ncbi:thiazole synthase [Buchnera aphidicola (Mindarus keteleerifoliae)]|uniref:thiazole synthase n=1 Tax=Buchnera aphidicola TaxID=9 RepID=UPI0031B7093E
MFKLSNKKFQSRLILGTGKFSSSSMMLKSIESSKTEMVTLAIARIDFNKKQENFLDPLKKLNVKFLPNTSGAKNAEEAVFAASLAKEALNTNWIKLEIHPDTNYLMPDPIETLKAAEILVKKKFIVMPYCSADLVLCKRLEEVGCAAVMPFGSPIGSNKGLKTIEMLKIIIEQSNIPVIIDAGIGAPSDATKAIEIGADAVLVNTAIAVSNDPITMAKAFYFSVKAGILARKAKLAEQKKYAELTSPLTSFLTNKRL